MHEDFQTASMIFNTDSLQPTYHLQVGESGDSYAFWLADKMVILALEFGHRKDIYGHG